jgi:flagellar basal-body rod modification protein FlgD
MSVSSITTAASLFGQNNGAADTSSIVPQQTLDQSDFLNLLIKQLASQDPMNPMSDTSFIAQMASFTSLQQTKETQASIAAMQANDMIGRVVIVRGGDGTVDRGTVDGVVMDSGTPNILVNGQTYKLNQVQTVELAQASAQTQGTNTQTQGVQS